MTIRMIQPLPAGNALRLLLDPPAGAERWRVLKMASDSFGGPDDLDHAVIAYEGDELTITDARALTNEVAVFYRPYYQMSDGSWEAGATATGTPAATYADHSTDVQSFVRDRLEAGLREEVRRGSMIAELGYIQVYTAPPSMDDNIHFPLVTVTLEYERPRERGIGESFGGDTFDAIGFSWHEVEGWLADVRLQIVGWSLNPDERRALRKALRRVIVANLPVFSSQGFDLIEVDMNDVDAVSGEYAANMYQVMASFSCIAPVVVGADVPAVADVEVQAHATYP